MLSYSSCAWFASRLLKVSVATCRYHSSLESCCHGYPGVFTSSIDSYAMNLVGRIRSIAYNICLASRDNLLVQSQTLRNQNLHTTNEQKE